MVSSSACQPLITGHRLSSSTPLKVLLSFWLCVFLSLPLARAQATPQTAAPGCQATVMQTIDFSVPDEGSFQPDFFKRQGIVFTEGDFVGFVQGDEALGAPIAGIFHPPVCSLSVSIAPALQGTAAYTLTAYSASGAVVGSTTLTVTQDMGDPETGPFGYFTLELTNLSQRAYSFTLENQFIRSSFPNNTYIPFAVSSITYTTPRPRP